MEIVKRSVRIAVGISPVRGLRRMSTRIATALRDIRAVPSQFESSMAHQAVLRDRHDQLLRFYTHFEALVETLCDAANYGPTLKLETRYEALRHWMLSEYRGLRPFVVAYLRLEPVDAEQALELHGRDGDAFEALFAAPTLQAFLQGDDGLMISRIDRAREALSLYGGHLRQLLGETPEG